MMSLSSTNRTLKKILDSAIRNLGDLNSDFDKTIDSHLLDQNIFESEDIDEKEIDKAVKTKDEPKRKWRGRAKKGGALYGSAAAATGETSLKGIASVIGSVNTKAATTAALTTAEGVTTAAGTAISSTLSTVGLGFTGAAITATGIGVVGAGVGIGLFSVYKATQYVFASKEIYPKLEKQMGKSELYGNKSKRLKELMNAFESQDISRKQVLQFCELLKETYLIANNHNHKGIVKLLKQYQKPITELSQNIFDTISKEQGSGTDAFSEKSMADQTKAVEQDIAQAKQLLKLSETETSQTTESAFGTISNHTPASSFTKTLMQKVCFTETGELQKTNHKLTAKAKVLTKVNGTKVQSPKVKVALEHLIKENETLPLGVLLKNLEKIGVLDEGRPIVGNLQTKRAYEDLHPHTAAQTLDVSPKDFLKAIGLVEDIVIDESWEAGLADMDLDVEVKSDADFTALSTQGTRGRALLYTKIRVGQSMSDRMGTTTTLRERINQHISKTPNDYFEQSDDKTSLADSAHTSISTILRGENQGITPIAIQKFEATLLAPKKEESEEAFELYDETALLSLKQKVLSDPFAEGSIEVMADLGKHLQEFPKQIRWRKKYKDPAHIKKYASNRKLLDTYIKAFRTKVKGLKPAEKNAISHSRSFRQLYDNAIIIKKKIRRGTSKKEGKKLFRGIEPLTNPLTLGPMGATKRESRYR